MYNETIIVNKPCEIVALSAESTPVLTSHGVTLEIQCDCYIEGVDVTTMDDSSYSVVVGTDVRDAFFIVERKNKIKIFFLILLCTLKGGGGGL